MINVLSTQQHLSPTRITSSNVPVTMNALSLLSALLLAFQQGAVVSQFPDSFDLFPPSPEHVALPSVNSSTRWREVRLVLQDQVIGTCGAYYLCNVTNLHEERTPNDKCSPCQPCSCDVDCRWRGDCCVDKTLDDLSEMLVLQTLPRQEATSPYGCRSLRYGNATTSTQPAFAYMIDACPSRWSDLHVAEKCLNGSLGRLAASWPVTSSVTRVTYRNEDCALCHGQETRVLRFWDLEIRCDQNVRVREERSLQALVEQVLVVPQCQVAFLPQDEQDRKECSPVAEDALVASCNVSGEQSTFDALLWKACEVFQAQVRSSHVFRNLFCFFCNAESATLSPHCQPDKPSPFVLVLRRPSGLPSAHEASESERKCNCAKDEIFDKYEGTCRVLHCSFKRVLKDDRCLSASPSSLGLAYQVSFVLSPDDANQQVTLSALPSLARVARSIRTAFLLKASSDSGWDVQIDYFRVVARVWNSSAAAQQTGTPSTLPTKRMHVVTFLVHVKFLTRWKEAPDALEKRLLEVTRAQWSISVETSEKTTFIAAPAHIKPENETGAYRTVSMYKASSDFIEYAVDIPDDLNTWQKRVVVENFEKVLPTLVCPKVFFPMPNLTDSSKDQLEVDRDTGAVYHRPSGKTVDFRFVDVIGEEEGRGGGVFVCAEQLFPSLERRIVHTPAIQRVLSSGMTSASLVCQSLAVVCLALTLLTLCAFSWRTLAEKNSIGVVASLLGAALLFEFGFDRAAQGHGACVALGVVLHFLLLSAFAWLLLLLQCAMRAPPASLPATILHKELEEHDDDYDVEEEKASGRRVFVTNLLISMALPAAVVVATLVGNYLASSSCDLDLGYGVGVCFLSNRLSLALASALPISLVIVVSLVLFCLTLRSHKKPESCQRARLCACVKLTLVTGITWLAGVAAVGIESEIVWCTFLVLCSVHGVYMVVTFVCNKRMINLYRKLFYRCLSRKETNARDEQKEPGEELAPCLMDSKSTSVNQGDLNGSMGNMTAVTDSKM